jgi:small conductance mechanosensitive channel
MTTLERFLNGEFVNPSTVLGALFYAAVFFTLAWVGLRSLRIALTQLEGGLLDCTSVRFLRRMGGAFIWVVAVILYANVIPELRAFGTALLAGASVASVLVGLAAQNTLGNMIAGLSLLLYRPFQIGDSVQLTVPAGVQTGKIEDLTLGYTVIKTQEDCEIVVPNSVMASQAIIKSA